MKTHSTLFSRKRVTLMGSLLITLLPVVVLADNCSHQRQVQFTVPADAIKTLDISAGAGTLRVTSAPDAKDFSVNARLCTQRERNLQEMSVAHLVQGDELHLWTKIPQTRSSFWSGDSDAIDLEVIVPAGMATRVTDGSGSASISGTGDLVVVDGSGSLDIFAIAGNVRVDDGSGELSIEDVQGDVSVDDGSGAIEISKVGGSVTLRDGSGSIDVREVQQEVTILEDGSGSVNIDRDMRYTSASANLD